jgi:hypothetical protein
MHTHRRTHTFIHQHTYTHTPTQRSLTPLKPPSHTNAPPSNVPSLDLSGVSHPKASAGANLGVHLTSEHFNDFLRVVLGIHSVPLTQKDTHTYAPIPPSSASHDPLTHSSTQPAASPTPSTRTHTARPPAASTHALTHTREPSTQHSTGPLAPHLAIPADYDSSSIFNPVLRKKSEAKQASKRARARRYALSVCVCVCVPRINM